MSIILYLFHSFLNFVIYVETTLISDFSEKNQRQWASFSINMAILFLSFKQATIVPNKLLNSQHYKWLRRKTLTAFHSPSHHAVKSIILKNFITKLLQNNSETGTTFSQPSIISFKCDKNIGKLVGQKFISNQWPVWNCQMRLLSMQNMSFN